MRNEIEDTHHDYLFAIHERKWAIALVFMGVVAATAYFTFTSPNIYEAVATLMVDPGTRSSSVLQLGYRPTGSNLIQNYCQVIDSRTVAEKTAERLADNLRYPSRPVAVSLVDDLMRRISAAPVRGTDMISVTARAATAEEAASISNAAVDVFIEQQIALVRGEYTEQRQFLEEQIPLILDRLQHSEEMLKAYKEENKFVALSEEARTVTEKLSEFDRLYSEVETEINTTTSRLNYLSAHLAEQQKNLPEDIAKVSSPYILELRKQLVNLEASYSMYLVQGLPEDHPKMLDLKAGIDEAQANLVEETHELGARGIPSLDPLSSARELVDDITGLEAEVVALEAKRDALSSVRQTYARRLESLPETELELARLERERELNANTYHMLVQKHEEVKIAEAGKMSNISVVDRAQLPTAPIEPRKARNLLFGAVVGLVLGLAAAFIMDYADTSVRTPADVDRTGTLTILGSIPKVKAGSRRRDRASGIVAHLITSHPSRSVLAESYRTVRTNLQYMSPDRPIRTLLITSPIPGEGKSTIAANLAITMALMGLKTLLIDSDFRKPVLRKVFGILREEGLTDLLTGKLGLNEAVAASGVDNLTILPAGTIPPNPSELLASKKMESLIEQIKKDYDFVIFDSPPVLAVTDAVILASKLDGVVLIASAGKTDKAALRRTREILGQVRANLLGVIMHMVKSVSGRYSYYTSYYYYHSYYDDKSDDKSSDRKHRTHRRHTRDDGLKDKEPVHTA
jgi:succinoglycan biosynthesis transport protein ExoP